jgi:hypothetical protein
MNFQFIAESGNAKVGKIPVTNSPRATCPSNCPLSGDGGCYAEGFHTRINWDKLDRGERGLEWSAFIDKIKALPKGQLWRHNVSGDLPSYVTMKLMLLRFKILLTLTEGKRALPTLITL